MRRWLFLTHRWLGLFGCLLTTLWFGSGFVMMYVPFPALTEAERLSALPVVTRPQVMPAQALLAAGGEPVEDLRLVQPVDGPVYGLRVKHRGWIGIDARTGERLAVGPDVARRAAERFSGRRALAVETLERDQWSVSGSLDPHRPLFAVEVEGGGRHYVSSRTSEVVRDTHRAERGWNWVGAVVHWVYPTALRSHLTAWRWTVIALSGYALVTALLGTVIGLLRWRRYANGRHSPYTRWMRWHHLLGLASAVFVLAWLFSGLMSMNPGEVFPSQHVPSRPLQNVDGGLVEPHVPNLPAGAREVQWIGDQDRVLVRLRTSLDEDQLLRDGRRIVVDEAFIRERAQTLGLGPVRRIERLDKHDLHYHARNAPRPLPVWRAYFEGERTPWVHFDSGTGQPFAQVDTSNRMARWLYHGLHSWDFEPLLQRRPLWDALMLAALTLGTALCVTSVAIAWRRLQRVHRRSARPPVLPDIHFPFGPRSAP